MRWSVTVTAEGDEELTREQVVELADAVAPLEGIASGIGTTTYGAQIVVEAESRAQALELGRTAFLEAVARAGLPSWPVTFVDALNELEDEMLIAEGDDATPRQPR